jgi:hypothetical protein
VRHEIQGEISLRGRVTAVGGIKEKLIGALRAGVKTVLLPAQNRKDVKDLPREVKEGLEIIHVGHVSSLLLTTVLVLVANTEAGTSGRPFATFGLRVTGQGKMSCLLSRAGSEMMESFWSSSLYEGDNWSWSLVR